MTLQNIISRYPRQRQALPDKHAAIYADQYKKNRDGDDTASSLAQGMESWMHKKIAAGGVNHTSGNVLEIGAGTLNHLPYESEHNAYDIVEPFTSLYEGSASLDRVRCIYNSLAEIEGKTYRRIFSVAVLEHLLDLPREVANAASLLEPGGVFQAGIPSEGGFLWWLGWRGTTGLSYFLKHGLDYGVLMRHEHVSTAAEIVGVVRYFFEDVTVERWPFNADGLSFYQYIEARVPNHDRVEQYLANSQKAQS